MNLARRKTDFENLEFAANAFGHCGADSILWSALNLLEAQLCTMDAIGSLHWHNFEGQIFAKMPLPQNIYQLGERLGINNFANLLANAKIENGVRTIEMPAIGILLRHDLRNGLLVLNKISQTPIYDMSCDEEARNLKKALDEKRMTLFKQPIVCAKNRTTLRFEALARMKREDGSIALPYEFIPAAERSGLIADLDIVTLEIALAEIEKNPHLHLATNVSFATISHKAARHEFYDLLRHNMRHAINLTVEITETIAIHDFDIANEFSNEIRKCGARLSLDDFGSGHTSFKSLRELPFDEVKIDGQYVKDIHQKPDTQKFVGALCHLIKDLGHDIIAERVECVEEARALQEFPIHGFQGYLFGKPQP